MQSPHKGIIGISMDNQSYFTIKFLKPRTITEEKTMFYFVSNRPTAIFLLLAYNTEE
jgi:hypothetical protein